MGLLSYVPNSFPLNEPNKENEELEKIFTLIQKVSLLTLCVLFGFVVSDALLTETMVCDARSGDAGCYPLSVEKKLLQNYNPVTTEHLRFYEDQVKEYGGSELTCACEKKSIKFEDFVQYSPSIVGSCKVLADKDKLFDPRSSKAAPFTVRGMAYGYPPHKERSVTQMQNLVSLLNLPAQIICANSPDYCTSFNPVEEDIDERWTPANWRFDFVNASYAGESFFIHFVLYYFF